MSLSWMAVEKALVAWLVAGHVGAAVYWGDQDISYGGPSQAYPFYTLRTTSLQERWTELRQSFDAGRSLNEEIEIQSRSTLIWGVSVQAYNDNANVVKDQSAVAMLARARARLRLDSVRVAFAAVGMGQLDHGDVANLTDLFETGYESRAALDCRFIVTEHVEEYLGYFNEVTGRLSFPDSGVSPVDYVITGD